MPSLRLYICLFLLLTGLTQVRTQDIHFTMFDHAPLTINPAFTGAFSGTFRLAGIYRAQNFSGFETTIYSTPSFSIDAPVFRGIGENDWIGAGLMFFQDKAGTAELQTGAMLGSVSYHLALDKNRKNVLTAAIQYGGYSRRIKNREALVFEDGIMSGGMSIDESMIPEDGEGFSDWSGGLLFTSRMNPATEFRIGIGAYHLGEPRASIGFDNYMWGRRFSGHAQLEHRFGGRYLIEPKVLFQNLNQSNELLIQTWGGMLIDPEKNILLRLGLGYRLEDAAQVLLGVDYGDIQARLGYDITVSDLEVANMNQGAFEIAISYIAKIYKKPKPDPVLFCPRF